MPTMEFGPILRSMRHSKVRFALIVLQSALTLAIVVNCITLINDARAKMTHPSGFDDDNLLCVEVKPTSTAYEEDSYRLNRTRQDVALLRAQPGVRAATNTRFKPWQGGGSSSTFKVHGSSVHGDQQFRSQIYPVDDGTLETLGIELVAGRVFDREQVERDQQRLTDLFASERPPKGEREPYRQDVVISKALAELLFADGQALGEALEDSDGDLYPIVGVVDPFYNPYGWPIHEYVVFYGSWSGSERSIRFLVRTEPGQASHVAAALEEALVAADPGRSVEAETILEVKANYFVATQAIVVMATAVIFLLLFVTAIGIVGVTSFSVTERTRHIGTRRALGARRADILRYFLLENWIVTSLGAILGVALAYGLNFALVSGATSAKIDPLVLAAGVVLLWLIGIGATAAPALRGARISPATATRSV